MRRPFLFPPLPPADRQLLGPRRCATMLTPSAIFLASSPRHPQLQRRLQFLSRLHLRRQIHHRPRFLSRLHLRRQIHHRPRFQSRLHRHLQLHRHLHRPHHLIHLHHLGHRCLSPFHYRRRFPSLLLLHPSLLPHLRHRPLRVHPRPPRFQLHHPGHHR